MMTKKRGHAARVLAVLFAFALLASACGDDDTSAEPTSGPTSEPTATGGAEETPTAAMTDPCGTGETDAGVTADTIKVALLVSVTGNNTAGQQGFEQGAEAYIEALNDRGGICNRQIEYKLFDDQSDSTLNTELFQEAVEDWGAFMVWGSFPDFSAAEYADSNGIPAVGTAYTAGWHYSDKFFGVTGGSWKAPDINNIPTRPSSTSSIDNYLADKIGAKTLATFGYTQSQSAAAANIACDNFTKFAAADQNCAFSDTTSEFGFSTIGANAARAKDAGATVFSAGMDIAGCVTITNDLRKAGITDFIFRCAVGIDDSNIPSFGHQLDNIVVLTTGTDFKSQDPAMVDFVDNLAEFQPGVDPGITTLNGWLAGIFFEDVVNEIVAEGLDLTRENFYTTARTAEPFSAWTANGLQAPIDWTHNIHEEVLAGTYKPAADACVGKLFAADVDAGEWVQVGPTPNLCLQTIETAADVAAYVASDTSSLTPGG